MYTKAQLDDAVADAVAAERVRTDVVQRAYKTLLAQTHEQHRLLNQALSLVSKQDEEIENLNLMLLVAKILGVKSEGADSDVFALLEGAMNVMGIHNLLPQSARRVDIAEVATELLSGDQILIRTAGSKQRFHHGIFVGPISGVQGGKNLVVDCWGSHDACKQEAKIRLRTLGEFMAVPGWPELAVPSFNEESNASEEPMTTTVEDYDALLRELENCRIKNQTLIKHNDELKLISETTMHENILLKSQLVPELSPYHFGHDLLTSLNLPFCNTKCCIVLLDSSGARQCKKNRQATGLLCTTHASSPKHVAEKVNKAYATRCFERHAKVISASQTQSDCVTAYTSACDDNKYNYSAAAAPAPSSFSS
eukprot:gene26642-biopygen3067